MGFFSRLFHRDKRDETQEETSSLDDAGILHVSGRSEKDLNKAMSTMTGMTDNYYNRLAVTREGDDESVVNLHFYVNGDGDNGKNKNREYVKSLDTIDDAVRFLEVSDTKVRNWIDQDKTLFQAMGGLSVNRVR